MRIVIEIRTGNEAMRTWGDVARAIATAIDRDACRDDEPMADDGCPLRDRNGNRVGSLHTEEG